jgi:hypothetical protein
MLGLDAELILWSRTGKGVPVDAAEMAGPLSTT